MKLELTGKDIGKALAELRSNIDYDQLDCIVHVLDSDPKQLYLVKVVTKLENDFDAGCHVAIWAESLERANEIAYDGEAEATGSEDDGLRDTWVEETHLVPESHQEFICNVFGVEMSQKENTNGGEQSKGQSLSGL